MAPWCFPVTLERAKPDQAGQGRRCSGPRSDRRPGLQSLFPEPRTDAQEGLYQHLIRAHTLIEDVGPITQEAGVKTLVLSHLVPGNRPDNVWEACGNGFDGQLIIGHDLDVIGVGTAT
jgi:hypothetical protein